MSGYDNVKLWFAKNEHDSIITIDEINEHNRHGNYLCPVCGSHLKPKAVKSKQVTSHFAHTDASKCNSESQIHFWFKHKFLEKGDRFTVISDVERDYVVKNILVEESCETENGIYKPDVTIATECGNTIYFEMAFTNKKKVKEYLDIWLELKNVVVEVNINQLINKNEIFKFKALFYDGKCFNTKKNDTYYNTIGKYKEEKLKGKVGEKLKERICKLDWFWNDVFRYKKGEVAIEYIVDLIDSIDKEDREVVNVILNKKSCANIYEDCINYKLNKFRFIIIEEIKDMYDEQYLNSIESYVAYDPYNISDKNVHGYIKIYDEEERCSESFDINKYNIKDMVISICKIINKNITYWNRIEKINDYNARAKVLEEKIKNNKSFISYCGIISDNGSYEVSCHVRTVNKYDQNIDIDSAKFNSYTVKFELKFNNERTPAEDFIVDITLNKDIEKLCDLMINKFEKYFVNLNRLNKMSELELLSKKINSEFEHCEIQTKGSVYFEDIYEIWVELNDRYLENYFITNEGIISQVGICTTSRGREFLIKSNNIKQIENYIIKDIQMKLKESLKRECTECTEKFTMKINEYKFYNKKGFELPKRCKSCRDKRKQ